MTTFDTLRKKIGDAVVEWDSEEHARHLADWSGHREPGGTPLAVAYPRSTQEVSAIVRACASEGVAMVPQGGLTGLAGGASPPAGSMVISLDRMASIEKIDRAGAQIVVQAGVTLQRIQEAAAEADLLFPLDLGARGTAQIGGNLATNAGGNRVLRYGMAREMTLGIEVVTPAGVVINAMNRMIKNNAGYDLKHLYIGSEGTLGIITRAVLRLYPRLVTQNVALCAVRSFDEVLSLLDIARSQLGGNLSAFEVMWDDFFAVANKGNARPLTLEGDYRYVVLIEAMGNDSETDPAQFQAVIENAFEHSLLCDAIIAQSQRDNDAFWAIRDASGELNQRFGPTINFDVSLPVEELDAFAQACRAELMAAVPETQVLVFGHIADGNIHFACLDPDGTAKSRLEEVVYSAVGRWQGSITAEHGVGVEKRAFLHHSRSPEYLDLMRTVKGALDPLGLMNPGKIFAPLSSDNSVGGE